jgi:hypothetical protein
MNQINETGLKNLTQFNVSLELVAIRTDDGMMLTIGCKALSAPPRVFATARGEVRFFKTLKSLDSMRQRVGIDHLPLTITP